jgi:hypothetical protein
LLRKKTPPVDSFPQTPLLGASIEPDVNYRMTEIAFSGQGAAFVEKAFMKIHVGILIFLIGPLGSCRRGGVEPHLRILTNHVGYEAAGPKRAVLQSDGPIDISTCSLRENASGRSVLDARPVLVGEVAQWKTWRYWTLDFDGVSVEGNYYLECATPHRNERSFPFSVEKNVLERNVLSNVIYYFKSQRSSGALDRADQSLSFEGSREGTVDARGGWFDASGDYGKHLSHLSFSTYFNPQQIPLVAWSLFKTLERLEARCDPAFAQYERRLLDEATFGADFLVRMRSPKGSFYRSVRAPGPGKRPADRRIAEDAKVFRVKKVASDVSFETHQGSGYDPKSYEVGYRAGGGIAIAALAIASTRAEQGAFKKAEYLEAAEGAFVFLETNNVDLVNDGIENIVDDYTALEAATELFQATHKPEYRIAADRRATNLMARRVGEGRYENFWRADDGRRPFFHASDAGFPVVALLDYARIVSGERKREVLDIVRRAMSVELELTDQVVNPFGYARQLVQNRAGVKRTSFFFPHDTEAAPWWQGENARLASLATAARLTAEIVDDAAVRARLEAYAYHQLSWILGENPFDACMLHGSGRNNPRYMFFDSYAYTNAPGGICNGITSGMKDEDGIDFNVPYAQTGADHDWRWGEQWLPHAAWFLLAVSVGPRAAP